MLQERLNSDTEKLASTIIQQVLTIPMQKRIRFQFEFIRICFESKPLRFFYKTRLGQLYNSTRGGNCFCVCVWAIMIATQPKNLISAITRVIGAEKNSFLTVFALIFLLDTIICQDRLGTNIATEY